MNPTAGIAGLLLKRGFERDPWVARATEYCFAALEELDHVGPDDAISVLTFLEHVPDRRRADEVFARLGERILHELVALDPATEGYVKTPLEFAPRPDRLARRLFDDATIEAHLDALEAKQQEDGGWPITWEPPSVAAVSEWRGVSTVQGAERAPERTDGSSVKLAVVGAGSTYTPEVDRRDRAAASTC